MQPQYRRPVAVVVAAITLAILGACGRPADDSGVTTASATRTESPSVVPSPLGSPLPIPDAKLLTASNCSGSAPATTPRALGGYYTLRIAPSWTDTGNYVGHETLLLELVAPQTYGFAPTEIQFHSDLGPVHIVYSPQATSDSIAQQHAASIASDLASPQAIAGTVSDCNVGGEPAAVFGYSDPTSAGYRLYVVHKDYLYEVRLFGSGGVSNQAIQDSVGMIGSLAWAS